MWNDSYHSANNIGQRTNSGGLDWTQPGMNCPLNVIGQFLSLNPISYGLPSIYKPVDISKRFSIYSNPTVASAYWGSVLHPNGKIYMIPYSETTVCEIDPNVGDATFFGPAGASTTKWRSGFLGKDGKIYCVPSTNSYIGIIDPIAKTIDTTSWLHGLAANYVGGCYGPDGNYYLTPADSSASIGWLNPVNRTVGEIALGGSYYYSGAVMAPDGKIWFIPRGNTNCLVLDVWSKQYEFVATLTNGYANFGYNGGVLAPNGKIYCAPSSADKILEIDTVTKKTKLIGNYTNGGTLAFCQAILAPDGYIYMIPLSNANIVKVDWINSTTEVIPCSVGSSKWGPGVFDKNGKFWSSTYSTDTILCIDFQQQLNQNSVLCAYGS